MFFVSFFLRNSIGSEIQAFGNWWGSDPPNEALFSGPVNFADWLSEPPLSTLPTISSVEPSVGGVSGGTLIQITGSRFVTGATVTIGGVPATGVSVDSETRITAGRARHRLATGGGFGGNGRPAGGGGEI